MAALTRLAASTAAATLLVLAPAPPALADSPCTKTWDGAASGADWDVAANWAPDGVPGEDDVVCVPAGISTDQDQTITVAAIRAAGAVRSSAQLTIDAETPAGAETSTVASFEKSSHLTSEGSLELGEWIWHGGFLNGAGTTTVKGAWESRGDSTFPSIQSPHTLITEGTSVSTANGLSLGGSARWINRGPFSAASGTFSGSGGGGAFPAFINEAAGTVTKTSSTGNLSFGVRTENDGLMRRAAGTGRLFVAGDPGAASDGAFQDVTLSDVGAIVPLGANAALTKVVNSADVRVPEDASVVVTDFTSSGGTLGGRGAKLVLAGHTEAVFGRIGQGPDLAADDRVARVTHPSGATMTWTAAMGFYASRFETDGSILIEETGLGRPQTSLGSGMLWENTGTITMLSGLLPTTDQGQRLVNRGRIVKVTQTSSTAGTMSVNLRFVNDGILEIERGTVSAPNFEQTSNGVVRFHLRGTTAGTQHGLLSSTRLRHSGRVESVLGEASPGVAYVPAPGSRHNVIAATAASRSGVFLSNGLAGGMVLDETGPSNIALVATAPTAVASRSSAQEGEARDSTSAFAPLVAGPAVAAASPAARTLGAGTPPGARSSSRARPLRRCRKLRKRSAAGSRCVRRALRSARRR